MKKIYLWINKNIFQLPIFVVVACFILVSIYCGFWVSAKIFLGFCFVFLLPGLAWSYLFWPNSKDMTSTLRYAFAVAFSITSVTFIEFIFNTIWSVKINLENTVVLILTITFLALIIIFLKEIYLKYLKNDD